ncbi:HAD family hydrolase [Tumebacillus permanentifrigoris]|uniref:HAD superfamily hydrolase (TIGR01549 family) n=1 Tax=Tumebacillus permanentifrigoris TaxID=378543 RepID=A0A316DW90_9BACL|nr:HAD family hydrolase [Tumebacillus permanentifrigoris]PWK13824.1 HAD superfamily hydrolase (TIGR01549 family) [Tumebacillus permanentifrigoris]
MHQVKTLLFDLDGTLLPMDNDHFTRGYFKRLVPRMAHLLPPETFLSQLLKSTDMMVRNNDPELTNEQVFKNDFLPAVNGREEDFWPSIEAFYAGEFGELIELSQPTSLAREICEAALHKGYQLVLATNPLFPRAATEHRMRWAGVEHIPFAFVTTYENSHFCKPNPNYYQEMVQKLGVAPESCMMIGNDAFEDLIAGTLGMQTYLVTDCLKTGENDLPFTHKGTLADLLNFVRNELPHIES